MIRFLVALVLLLVVLPFVDELRYGLTVEAVLLSTVFLSAIPAVGGRRRTLLTASALLLPALLSLWIGHLAPTLVPAAVTQAFAVLFGGFIAIHLGLYIVQAPRVDNAVLCAAVANYLMLAFVWAFAYSFVAQLDPSAFVLPGTAPPQSPLQRFEAVYFSFVTLTTVGYGDILPVSPAARMLAMLQATTGMFYMAILVSRLVSMYSSRRFDSSSLSPE